MLPIDHFKPTESAENLALEVEYVPMLLLQTLALKRQLFTLIQCFAYSHTQTS
jgi:hypothetical protein